MPRDMKEKIMEAAIIGCLLGGILGLTAFVLTFVNTGTATVLAIFACMFIVSSTILIGVNSIIKTIEESSGKETKTKNE